MPAHARLRRVAGHLDAAAATAIARPATAAAAVVVSRRVIAEPADLGAGLLPLQLAPGLDASGRLQPLPESLDRLRQAMHAAAAAGDFRLATALQDVLFVAEPTAPLTVEACAPESPEECWDFFVENGFVCVRDLFGPEQLARIQAAWRRVQGPARALWQQAHAEFGDTTGPGMFFDQLPPGHGNKEYQKMKGGRLWFDIYVDDFFQEAAEPDGDPALLDLIAPPKLVSVLEQVVGPAVRLDFLQCRTVPPEQEGGYTTWHRDTASGPPDAWPYPSLRQVKVLLYINDVTEEQGPTSVVRGSHRIPFGGVFSGPKGIFDLASAGFEGFAGGSSEHTAELGFAPLSSVPNHVKFAAKAGDCCIFDISSWREYSILHAFPLFDNI